MRYSILCIVLAITSLLFAQNWNIEEVGRLPFKTSNNAVALAYQNDQPLIYSFCGIDTTLEHSGIHLKAGAVNINSGASIRFSDVPDTLGKIAASASTVKNKIYIIGGYHVYANGSEISSNKVHCFDPEKGIWEADKKNIPVPIDDHVQAVWQDSLIYVITGWSNTKNVPDVQIFNPTTNEWLVGSAVPDNAIYTAFGASGTIIGNTIYYLGGASMSNNFPATWRLRIGEINPNNPAAISWRDSLLGVDQKFYRAGCANLSGYPMWFGGSSTTYNYNALAYATNTVVQPAEKSYLYVSQTESAHTLSPGLPMDLRGVGELNPTTKVLAGGMYADRVVSDKVLKVQWGFSAEINKLNTNKIAVYPNPGYGTLNLSQVSEVEVYALNGQLMYAGRTKEINTKGWDTGVYYLSILTNGRLNNRRIMVTNPD